MKYRVTVTGGETKDFDIESEAYALFSSQKTKVKRMKVIEAVKPACMIHKCYHDEASPRLCEVIERYVKE